MATNFGTEDGGVLNTTNMKPESAEQIDSIWGQNESDNIAFCVWGKERKAFDLSVYCDSDETIVTGWAYWRKLPHHDTLNIVGRFNNGPNGTAAITFAGALDRTFKSSTVGSAFEFTYDQTGLANGSVYEAQITVQKTTTGAGDFVQCSMGAWSGTTPLVDDMF